MKVLVADDDPTSRKMLEAVLPIWGYEVISAKDGKEAWQILTQPNRPSLAILDWMMPEMDGVEICKKVRALENGSPLYLIILTVREEKKDIVKGLKAGADDYLAKPFHPEELRARLDVGKRLITLQNNLAARVKELQEALDHIKTLQGILPICMYCHKIRTDKESWQRLENYICEHSDAEFSHSICPECMEKHFPEND